MMGKTWYYYVQVHIRISMPFSALYYVSSQTDKQTKKKPIIILTGFDQQHFISVFLGFAAYKMSDVRI